MALVWCLVFSWHVLVLFSTSLYLANAILDPRVFATERVKLTRGFAILKPRGFTNELRRPTERVKLMLSHHANQACN